MQRNIIAGSLNVLALMLLAGAFGATVLAQVGGSVDCVGKAYGYPGCPLKQSQTSSVPPTCGNGLIDNGEECDAGKARNGLGNCTTSCTLLYCGDGIVSRANSEECEPEREERYVQNPSTGELEVEQRYLQPTCGSICTVPQCDSLGNCTGGCKRKFLPACALGQSGGVAASTTPEPPESAPSPQIILETARCGDGTVQSGEECDDADTIDGNGCTNACRLPTCGDGILQASEQCDDGNVVDGDQCSNACTLAACGDGVQQEGEECDDGNQVGGDQCTSTCKVPRCGDGILQRDEECDDGNSIESDACTALCRKPRCGDGIVQQGEECDDGNATNEDACTGRCKQPRCGDGIHQENEECDDGNRNPGDGCSNLCTLPACGNVQREGDEECDDGNTLESDACTNSCRKPRCGDGILQAGEECDDGNQINDDACANSCRILRCGDGILQAGEECDDGRANSNTEPDVCRNNCRLPRCGDGVVDRSEECDPAAPLGAGGEDCSRECKEIQHSAAPLTTGGTFGGVAVAFLGGGGLLAAGAAAWKFLRRRTGRPARGRRGRRGILSIDDIPLDEIEMPWHKW